MPGLATRCCQACRYLRHLNVEHNGLPDRAVVLIVKSLFACPEVTQLVLRGNDCGVGGATALARLMAWQDGGDGAEAKVSHFAGNVSPVSLAA